MKRSLVNSSIRFAKELLEKHNIRLPDFGYWTLDEWKSHKDELDTIKQVMLGWDLTDHGLGRFDVIGCTLFTIRNGLLHDPSVGVPYAEKLLIFQDGQRLPIHFHGFKTEDIINRAGAPMYIKLWNTVKREDVGGDVHEIVLSADGVPVESVDRVPVDSDVEVYMDGIKHVFKAGEEILIYPGNSITIPPGLAHTFGVKKGAGDLVCGEVSKINDDNTDNYHIELQAKQWADIYEDEPILHPRCNEYERVIG